MASKKGVTTEFEEIDEEINLTDDAQYGVSRFNEERIDSVTNWQSVYTPTTMTLKYEKKSGLNRYRSSLKHLMPIRVRTGPGSLMPVDQAGCFSFIFYSWLTPLGLRSYRKGLTMGDMYQTSPFDSCKVNAARLATIWDMMSKENAVSRVAFRKALFRFVRTRFILICFFYILCLLFGFIGPTIFLRLLLEYVQSNDDNYGNGLKWMAGLMGCEIFRIVGFMAMWAISNRLVIRTQSGIVGILYRKIIKLRNVGGKTTGEMINVFSNDCQKVMLMWQTAPFFLGGPLLILASLVYAWWLFGVYCLVGVGVFVFAYLFQFTSKLNQYFRKKAVKATDKRVSLMSELLTYIKLIKLYAWEKPFGEKIVEMRGVERSFLEKCQFINTFQLSITLIIPQMATVFTILVYCIAGNELIISEVFTLMMINSLVAHGIRTLPVCVRDLINGFVSLGRIEQLLHADERESYTATPSNPDYTVSFVKATLTWEKSPEREGTVNPLVATEADKSAVGDGDVNLALVTPSSDLPIALKDITFVLPKGQLIGVCGAVGSGKSSLLSAILGQMKLVRGDVYARYSCAYVSQEPWLLNATLRENILFGQPFNSKKYYEAIYCCCLQDDIASLPAEDQTEIGERGVTLSGGQKQRVSLARAVYADKALYLLDDPLSAVDVQVGEYIFQNCIRGTLKGRSILFVSNQQQFLQECDSVIFMNEGRIAAQGGCTDLLNCQPEFAAVVQTSTKKDNVEDDDSELLSEDLLNEKLSESPTRLKSVGKSVEVPNGRLIQEERIATGDMTWQTYRAYIKAAGGHIVCMLVLLWFLLQGAVVAFSKWWLSEWISKGSGESETGSVLRNPRIQMYQIVYGLSVAAMITVSAVLGYFYTKITFKASSQLHRHVFQQIIQRPMHFFDTIPVGRILNLFTRDLDEVDTQIPFLMDSFLQNLMALFFNILIVALIFPWFLLAICFLSVLFLFLYQIFRGFRRDIKRLENAARSPVLSHIGATLQGLPTIKAFQKQEEFVDRFTALVDSHSSPLYLLNCSQRWTACRLEFLCLIITLLTALFVIFLKNEASPAFAGLAITLAMQMNSSFMYLAIFGCDLSVKFTSVERLVSYLTGGETESYPVIKEHPPKDWPSRGRISFRDVNMIYRAGLRPALRDITFDISPLEKVGIVGRTGAGKSSIAAALFRLSELSSGTIHIDGLDISTLGVEDLRSRMSIVPQDPSLFFGTIRYNLDPFQKRQDTDLWDALEKTHMKEKVLATKGGLDAIVEDRGENFSTGERQLLCIARVLLRHSKIVLLDEATAAMDGETDGVLQQTIQEVFGSCTVLTIAHRLNTVLNCDRVMVLKDGQVVEFDPPSSLMSNEHSHFAQMISTFRAE